MNRRQFLNLPLVAWITSSVKNLATRHVAFGYSPPAPPADSFESFDISLSSNWTPMGDGRDYYSFTVNGKELQLCKHSGAFTKILGSIRKVPQAGDTIGIGFLDTKVIGYLNDVPVIEKRR